MVKTVSLAREEIPLERKSIKDFVLTDMWNNNMMVGNDIRNSITGEGPLFGNSSAEEFCQGIFCTFPHMMLKHFVSWMWPDGEPKDYQEYMDRSLPQLQEKVFPQLASFFHDNLTGEEKGRLVTMLLTEVIPQYIFNGFYDYMFSGDENYKDISGFWTEVAPLLEMSARLFSNAYNMSDDARVEVFRYAASRYPFLLLKRWYDWQFGKDMPPKRPF